MLSECIDDNLTCMTSRRLNQVSIINSIISTMIINIVIKLIWLIHPVKYTYVYVPYRSMCVYSHGLSSKVKWQRMITHPDYAAQIKKVSGVRSSTRQPFAANRSLYSNISNE
jgi:hypothetical protein